jgi:aldehyde dehydrogenase (NAD+)
MVSINSVIAFAAIASVPFGGVKDSGYGRIHGPEGFFPLANIKRVVSSIAEMWSASKAWRSPKE